MQGSFRKVTAVLVTLCLLFGGVGLAPEVANTTGSPVAKAKVKKYSRYVKTETLDVHKKASGSSRVVVTLKKDKKVTQYGPANSKGWVKIRYKKNKYGYVKRKSLAKQPDILAIEDKAIEKIKAIAEKYGWEVYSVERDKSTDDGVVFVTSKCQLKNDKYLAYVRDYGETELNFFVRIFTSPEQPVESEQFYGSPNGISSLLKKYQA